MSNKYKVTKNGAIMIDKKYIGKRVTLQEVDSICPIEIDKLILYKENHNGRNSRGGCHLGRKYAGKYFRVKYFKA